MITAEQIRKDVVDQLYWDGRLEAAEVQVDVHDGEVILQGYVPSYAAHEAAEADALAVPGVLRVKNRTTIGRPPAGKEEEGPSDGQIAQSVNAVLSWNRSLSGSAIVARADDGVVTLEGSVDAYWKKQRAQEVAYEIIGVLSVMNEIAVVPSGDHTDQAIAENIRLAMERSSDVFPDLLTITVEDGDVQIKGEVPDWSGYYSVRHIAQYTAGVTNVAVDVHIRDRSMGIFPRGSQKAREGSLPVYGSE
ncbi:MAG: BON domain-containing protein [Chitinispirillaceae bacterium]